MKVSIGVSNRHVHLTKEDFKVLFGENFELEKKNDLTQPGQFASTATITIKTDKSMIEGVRILGPFRNYTQIEISRTDSFKLGLNPPVRDSGDLKNSSPITLIGPKGTLKLDDGCIIATRHIHLTKEHALMYHLEEKDFVSVKLYGEKGGIIDNVHLKYSDEAYFELHLDTDDANAHLIKNGDIGDII